MASFDPKNYGNLGLSYANWQQYAGMKDTDPFGPSEGGATQPVAPSNSPASAPPAPIAPTSIPALNLPGLGTPPTGTTGVNPFGGTQQTPSVNELDAAISKFFGG